MPITRLFTAYFVLDIPGWHIWAAVFRVQRRLTRTPFIYFLQHFFKKEPPKKKGPPKKGLSKRVFQKESSISETC